MVARIVRSADIDLSDVLRRSPVADIPLARDKLRAFIFASCEVWAGYVDTEVACVCGLIPPTLLSDYAYLWLLNTDIVEQHQFLFIRHSQIWLQGILKRYSYITGHVELENVKAIRWLKWLGATLGEPEMGKIPFRIRAR